jgi:hypothetical protein
MAFAFNGSVLQWAVYARPYAGVIACVALAFFMVQRQLALPAPTTALWVGYAAAATAAVLLHPFSAAAASIFVVMLAFAAAGTRTKLWLGWLVASIAPVIAAVWLLAASMSQRSQISAVLLNVQWIRDATAVMTGLRRPVVTVVLLVVIVVAAKVVARFGWTVGTAGDLTKSRDPAFAGAISLLGLPALVLLAGSHLFTPMLIERYIASTTLGAPLVVGAASGVVVAAVRRVGLPGRWGTPAAAVATVAILAVTAFSLLPRVASAVRHTFYLDDVPGWSQLLLAKAKSGDYLTVHRPYGHGGIAASVAYYLNDDAFAADVTAALRTTGEPEVYERRIVAVGPDGIRTEPAWGAVVNGTVWRGWIAFYEPRPAECTEDDSVIMQGGDFVLREWHCDGFRLTEQNK